MSGTAPGKGRFGDLGTRIVSGLVLAVVAAGAIWAGGVLAVALVGVALCLMLWELHRMVSGEDAVLAPALLVMGAAGLAAAVVTATAGLVWGLACLLPGALIARLLADRDGDVLAAGMIYMGGALAALLAFRFAGADGALVILWLVMVIAAADIGAYFAGRSLGGPKLWPAVSPGKTRSGAVGGLMAAGVVGIAVALATGWAPGRALVIGVGVAVASQAGDLLESALKRHYGVKDASTLIPGHGGVMDRLDGVMGGAWFYALWTLVAPGVNGS